MSAPGDCDYCPKPSEVHNGKAAEVFLMAVVNVPGRTPVIASTPKFCKDLPADPTACDVCAIVSELVDESVIKGAVDLAAEIRGRFRPHDEPVHPGTTDGSQDQSGGAADGDRR